MNFLLVVFGLMIAVLIFGTVHKYLEVRQAAHWLRTEGTVRSARSVARRVRTAETWSRARTGGDLRLRNFADIRYEYQVRGRRYTGNRVSLGEDLGDFRVAETLARYPAGQKVVVHYDPADPSQAVLENEAPEGVWRTMTIFIVVLAGVLIGGTVGFDRLVDMGASRLWRPPGRMAPPLALAGLAAFLVLLGMASRRQLAQVRAWLTTTGQVVSSRVDSFLSREPAGGEVVGAWRWRVLYRPEVVYQYTVGGVSYQGDRIAFGARVYATTDLFARRPVADYPVGDAVTVHYNPVNAAEAVLEPRVHGEGVVWVLAALLAGGAVALWVT